MSEELIEHPFENLFDIESGSTVLVTEDIESTELVPFDKFDNKDIEIENQYQSIYDAAYSAFNFQITAVERGGDPKNYARNMEVANQFLSTALSAVKEKADLKQKKEKLVTTGGSSNAKNITNNNLIMDRNDLLKIIQGN
jgi:hypothetical protein